jgi:hypothetical protein
MLHKIRGIISVLVLLNQNGNDPLPIFERSIKLVRVLPRLIYHFGHK